MLFIGIDPGIAGAIAVLNSETNNVHFFDTPVVEVKSGKSMKRQMNPAAATRILSGLVGVQNDELFVSIEKVAPMPSFKRPKGAAPDEQIEPASMGVTSAFNFGMNFGMWIGICAALMLPYELVHPATWKSVLMRDMGKEKDASRVKCMQLFPRTAVDLARKKDHGRADALLIAEYGRRTYTPRKPVPQAEPAATLFD